MIVGLNITHTQKNSSVGREPPFREDLSPEAEEEPLLKPLPGNV
jgi:hypothetical protein